MRKIISIIVCCTLLTCLHAQEDLMHNINLQASFLYEVPGSDLADRYGPDTKFEFKLEYLSHKQYATYIKGGIRVNQNVREDVLATFRTKEGFVIGVNGFYADIFGRKRGFDIGLGVDKLFPLGQQQLRVGLGVAYITHWVNFVDDSQSVPQVIGTTSQLYDRFVSGMGMEENIQYQYRSKNTRAVFLFGFQLGQFFTTEHRQELIGNGAERQRLDLYYGAKLTYMLPLYSFSKGEKVYY